MGIIKRGEMPLICYSYGMNKTTEKGRWHSCSNHDWQSCKEVANCYSYVLVNPNYFWSVPGFGYIKSSAKKYFDMFNEYFGGYTYQDYCDALKKGAEQDGLIPIDKPQNNEDYYTAALFFPKEGNELDFHWYKLEDNGTWTHKNGRHNISDLDDGSNLITDVQKAYSKDFQVFGGYYLVPRGGISLYQQFPSK